MFNEGVLGGENALHTFGRCLLYELIHLGLRSSNPAATVSHMGSFVEPPMGSVTTRGMGVAPLAPVPHAPATQGSSWFI